MNYPLNLNTFNIQLNQFQKARLKLTFYYILISICLLTIFSIAAINAEKVAFTKIIQSLGPRSPRPRVFMLNPILEQRIDSFEEDFKLKLLQFDLILLVGASLASYFLSGRTLKPIEEMVKAQEEFSADASHELRTPLTTINMEIEALKLSHKSLPKDISNTLDSIQDEVKRMKHLVDGLLTIVRDQETPQLGWKNFNLSKVIEETALSMQKVALEKDIKFTFNVKKNVSFIGDPDQLKQLSLILLDNAIKFTPSKGKITLNLTKNNKGIYLIVTDTGIGISKDLQEKIFERFYKGKNSKGSGLGLSIAKKFVEYYNGEIKVESDTNKGTKFIVKL